MHVSFGNIWIGWRSRSYSEDKKWIRISISFYVILVCDGNDGDCVLLTTVPCIELHSWDMRLWWCPRRFQFSEAKGMHDWTVLIHRPTLLLETLFFHWNFALLDPFPFPQQSGSLFLQKSWGHIYGLHSSSLSSFFSSSSVAPYYHIHYALWPPSSAPYSVVSHAKLRQPTLNRRQLKNAFSNPLKRRNPKSPRRRKCSNWRNSTLVRLELGRWKVSPVYVESFPDFKLTFLPTFLFFCLTNCHSLLVTQLHLNSLSPFFKTSSLGSTSWLPVTTSRLALIRLGQKHARYICLADLIRKCTIKSPFSMQVWDAALSLLFREN